MISNQRLSEIRRELSRAQAEIAQTLQSEKTRKRAELNRRLHEIRQMLAPGYAFMSQAGQDTVVDRYFKQMTGGTFIDIGGYDGVTGSNTVFLEKWRNWTGVLVEPVETYRARAAQSRACPCLAYAVSDTAGKATFMSVTDGFTQMSGLTDTYDESVLNKVRENPKHKEVTIEVETRTLAQILEEAGITHPDFVSLDIEGGELSALQAFPFDAHRVGIWAIENNTASREINDLMRSKGYDLIDFCGPDEIYALPKT